MELQEPILQERYEFIKNHIPYFDKHKEFVLSHLESERDYYINDKAFRITAKRWLLTLDHIIDICLSDSDGTMSPEYEEENKFVIKQAYKLQQGIKAFYKL